MCSWISVKLWEKNKMWLLAAVAWLCVETFSPSTKRSSKDRLTVLNIGPLCHCAYNFFRFKSVTREHHLQLQEDPQNCVHSPNNFKLVGTGFWGYMDSCHLTSSIVIFIVLHTYMYEVTPFFPSSFLTGFVAGAYTDKTEVPLLSILLLVSRK